jgi:sugar-specific transcriptional regulator TrmB
VSREEITETIYGIENILPLLLQCFARIKDRYDSCGDHTLPSAIVTTEPIKNAYKEILRRGIKTRFLTEITEKNIEYCKELMKIVYELRHLEGVKGNFSVSESDYIATAIQQEGRPIPQLIHSNAKAMIEEHQYFFETLWNKAIPAEKKIREMEKGIPAEVTEIWYGSENIIKKSWEIISRAKVSSDYCHNSKSPSIFVTNPYYLRAIMELNERGVRHRFVTEITKENIKHCKELAKYVELRHIGEVKGNFAIIDGKEYGATANLPEFQPPTEFIHSNVNEFVDQQQHFFETLWSKAIPARQRFKEIEQGAKRDFVETVRDPQEIQQLAFDLIKRAEEEIEILFSMTNASRLQAKSGSLKLLQEAALSRGVKVRILLPVNDDNETAIMANETILQLKEVGVDIRQIKKEEQLYPLQNKLTLLLVDQSVCLTTELDEDPEEPSEEEAIGLATYSNSEPTIFAYSSIFENLWIHAEIMLHD